MSAPGDTTHMAGVCYGAAVPEAEGSERPLAHAYPDSLSQTQPPGLIAVATARAHMES